MADHKAVFDEFNRVLMEIDDEDPDLAEVVASFAYEQIIDEANVSTYTLALQYVNWARQHKGYALGEVVSHGCRTCLKNSKWIFDPDDPEAVRPCDKCSGDRVQYWTTMFVDSDRGPA